MIHEMDAMGSFVGENIVVVALDKRLVLSTSGMKRDDVSNVYV